MKHRVKSFMKELDFKQRDDYIFGIYDGYLISIKDSAGTATFFADVTLGRTADMDREKIRAIIEESANQYAILRAEVKNTGILVVFDSSLSAFNRLRDFFYFFVQQLKALSIPGASICTNCGLPISSINILSINDRLHTCDKECAAHLVESSKNRLFMQRKRNKTNFLAGAVGGLFGAILGIVPFVLAGRIGIFALWAGLVIGALAKWGYELFGGKACLGKIIVLPIFSLLAPIPAVFLIYSYDLSLIWQEKKYVMQFREAVQTVYESLKTSSALQTAMLKDVLISFGFAVLGLLLLIRFTKKQTDRSVYIVS